MSDNYEIWTTDEVMDYLLVGRNTLYNLLRNGKIKGFNVELLGCIILVGSGIKILIEHPCFQ